MAALKNLAVTSVGLKVAVTDCATDAGVGAMAKVESPSLNPTISSEIGSLPKPPSSVSAP